MTLLPDLIRLRGAHGQKPGDNGGGRGAVSAASDAHHGNRLASRRLRGSRALVFFCPDADGKGEVVPGEAGHIPPAWEAQAVARAMRAWRGAMAEADAEATSGAQWIDWRRHLRCWRGWRQVVLQEAAERAQQVLQLISHAHAFLDALQEEDVARTRRQF